MSCLYEPIHGRFPTKSLCDSYPDCVGCNYSDSFKQPKQTFADRIRAMTDEEMAEFMERTKFYVCKQIAEVCGIYNLEEHWDKDGIVKEEIEWLKQDGGT